MVSAMRGEATAVVDGVDLHLVMDNPAFFQIEAELNMSIFDLVNHLAECERAKRPAQMRVLAGLLWGATRANHPEMSMDDCARLLWTGDKGLQLALGEATRGALPAKDSAPGEAKAPTAAKPAALKTRGTGTKSRRSGAKRVERPKASGGKPHAPR